MNFSAKCLYFIASLFIVSASAVMVEMPSQQVIAANLRSFRTLDNSTGLSRDLANKKISVEEAAKLVDKKHRQFVKGFASRGEAALMNRNASGLYQAVFRDHPEAITELRRLGYIQ